MSTPTTTVTSHYPPGVMIVTTEMFVIQFDTNTPETPKWNIRRSTNATLSVSGAGWPKSRDWRRIRKEIRRLLGPQESIKDAIESLQRAFENTKWFNESYDYGR